MAIPAYTPPASPEATVSGTVRVDHAPDAAYRWMRRRVDRSSLGRRSDPRLIQGMLDVVAIALILVAFGQTTFSAEFVFHCIFVLLVLHAFLFGLRGTLLRIGLVSIPLIVYADAKAFGLVEPPLELTEWPLMFVIAVLVALMAERRNSTSRRYAALFRRASERLLTVEEDERRRIAGELHDGVGQVITALTLVLDAAGSEDDPKRASQHVVVARGLADSALAATRDISHRIRPSRLEERGLVAAVRDLASRSGFPVVVHAGRDVEDPSLLGPTATVEVYRIIQEALANAARHSGASQADVSITRQDDSLTVVVSDAGSGFDPADVPGSGIGLAGMLERSVLLGGALAIDAAPGAGTRVTISLPAPMPQAATP
jgi:signal transduction histidine kinase